MLALYAQYGDWVLSTLSLVMAWATGNKWRGAWLFGIFVQAFWIAWIIVSGRWGFFVLSVLLALMYARNYWRWSDELGEGWVVSDAQGVRFRCWDDYGPSWTWLMDDALMFSRRADAEAFCAEDEDAWLILRVQFPINDAEQKARKVAQLYSVES